MRTSAKLVVVARPGRVLLLECVDPARPDVTWWELPGGGIEPGEDGAAAAAREVREEAGLVVDPQTIGPVLWTQDAAYSWLGRRHLARHEGRVARLRDEPVWTDTALTGAEAQTIRGLRWWDVADVCRAGVAAAGCRFFPRSLPTLLPRLLAGERVDEPYDDWDLL